jgi:predicted nucleotidyltransferase
MARKRRIQAGEKIGLKLTQAERNLLLDALLLLPEEVEQAVHATPPSGPLMLSLDELDDLAGHVAAAANHALDKRLRSKLDRISRKIADLLERHTDQPEPSLGEATTPSLIENFLDMLAGERPMILPMESKSRQGEDQYPLKLTEPQREALIAATRLRRGLKTKLQQVPSGTQVIGLTRTEMDETASEVDIAVEYAPSPYKKRLQSVMSKLEDLLGALEENEPIKPSRKGTKKADRIYQLKITLKDIKPPIWRRIQVPDCPLGDLHEVIQIAMGWTDSHLHEFIVRGDHYGPRPPEDLDLGMEMEVEDEDAVVLSRIQRGTRKFRYVYDFGDGWQHEIEFEQIVEREPRIKYPRCVAGERACPPEDVGGPWGYAEFLDASADTLHEQHEKLLEWVGGEFNPEEFSVEEVNEHLRQLR